MKIPAPLTRAVGRQLLVARQHAPQILFGAGIIGVVSSTVLACKATLKLGDKLDDMKSDIDNCKKEYYNPEILAHREYTKTDNRKELAYIYARDTAGIAKLYAPAVIVGVSAIACLTGSHVTLTRRNAALTAAYTSLFETFKSYRDRVRDQVGEEKERELYLGAPIEIDKKTGEKMIKNTEGQHISQYARWFDASNPNWQLTSEYNQAYIKLQMFRLNDRLKARGHVFLNEVYDDLGLSHTADGAIVGWVWPPREGCDGDIICDIMISRQDFHIGNEYQILLDFNVDGIIWNLLP